MEQSLAEYERDESEKIGARGLAFLWYPVALVLAFAVCFGAVALFGSSPDTVSGQDPSIEAGASALTPEQSAEADRQSRELDNLDWIPVASMTQPVDGYLNGDQYRAWQETLQPSEGGPVLDPKEQFTAAEPGLPVYAEDHETLIGFWVLGEGLVLLDEIDQGVR